MGQVDGLDHRFLQLVPLLGLVAIRYIAEFGAKDGQRSRSYDKSADKHPRTKLAKLQKAVVFPW